MFYNIVFKHILVKNRGDNFDVSEIVYTFAAQNFKTSAQWQTE